MTASRPPSWCITRTSGCAATARPASLSTRAAASIRASAATIPVNVSGGLLSKGHPLGATGVANICEVVWHLTQDDRAKERQVPNAKVGMAHVIGLGSACTIHVLTI